jgi:hypothetical protein
MRDLKDEVRSHEKEADARDRRIEKNEISISWLKGVLAVLIGLNVGTFILVLTIVLTMRP